jgi:1-acyl-sn-glycerol-3-phosphate acyltransferase
MRPSWWRRWQRDTLLGFVRLLIGGRALFERPPSGQALYFSNHASHLDTLILLAALPPAARDNTRPVAGKDYWDATALRRYIANHVLNVVLIDRVSGGADALAPLAAALAEGYSLIVFPEGTRGKEKLPGPFKSGLFHLSAALPQLELVPVYLENMHRAMPKGAPFPLPLLCRAHFGAAINNDQQEAKEAFIQRAHQALCALAQF